MIITIRTDKPESEIGLYKEGVQIAYKTWTAHRELGATIHTTIIDLLQSNDATLEDLTGVIFYEGPGSFTGLRIGASVANALAVSLGIPITQSKNDDWIADGLQKLANNDVHIAQPFYGSEAFTTKPKK